MPKLEHDPQLVKSLALVHEGNGKARRKIADQCEPHDGPLSSWSQNCMLAASSLAIAASLWSLIEPARATRLYRTAAHLYREIGHGYWIVLALASGSEHEIATVASVTDESPPLSPQTVAFALVANEVSESRLRGTLSEVLDSHWRHTGNLPIGRLRIPLDYYAHCAQAMRGARAEKNADRFFSEAGNYVRRAAEVLRSARHDRFHWPRLETTILPAEPEAVAMTAAMSVMSRRVFGVPISNLPNLDAHGRLLIEVGDELQEAARSTNGDGPE
jgi:hypothetical protein